MISNRRNRTLSLAGLGAAAATGSAQGAIVSSGTLDQTLTGSDAFDFDGDSSTDLTLSATTGKILQVTASGSIADDGGINGNSAFPKIDLLDAGATVDAALSYTTDEAYFALDGPEEGGEWLPAPTTGYFGFSFEIAGNTHYGYGELTVSTFTPPGPTAEVTAILHAWAYEDVAGQGINIPTGGDVPLPGTAALFAAGGAAVLLKRLLGRRRA